MAKLTAVQIAGYAKGAGFPDSMLPLMTQIAFAESGGDPNQHTVDNDDDSYGLWQINMRKNLGPTRRKWFGLTNDAQLLDPATNAKAAYMIYQKQGLQAWGAYTNGSYKRFRDAVKDVNGKAIDALTAPIDAAKDKVSDAKDAATAPITAVAASVNAFGSTLAKLTSTASGIAIGIVLLILGVVILSRNVIPVGKAFNAVKKLGSSAPSGADRKQALRNAAKNSGADIAGA